MSIHRGSRIDELFHDALAIPDAQREAWLDARCNGNASLRTDLESLLASHRAAAHFMETPVLTHLPLPAEVLGHTQDAGQHLSPGTILGRYRVEDVVASGGMGSVYHAVRADGLFEQQVAIKCLRFGTPTEAMLDRFHRERQTLARLEHPCITRLIDGGTTADGLPYLVMEYVEGLPIHHHCERHQLSIRDRLRLFQQVAEAVHYAHQNLIVHRDLKPENILVTPSGLPKLLDFGISTLLRNDDDGNSIRANLADLPAWTPRYASPEQVAGEPITTVSDVYSLGVILHELLAGRPPLDLESLDIGMATDTVASSPSRSHVRNNPPPRFHGDLNPIVKMATAHEPSRRYASAQQLSEDIRRYLDGFPVLARRATAWYRITKLVTRNRGIAGTLIALIAALIIGIVGTSKGILDARQAQRQAIAERSLALQAQSEAQAVTHFLQEVLAAANPYRKARDVTVLELLEDAADRIESELPDQPAVEAGVRLAIAKTYAGMWHWDQAVPHLRRSLQLKREVRGPSHPDVAECLSWLGRALTFLLNPESEILQREALAIRRSHLGESHPMTAESMGNLGYALWHGVARPQWNEAEKLYRGCLAILVRSDGDHRKDQARFTFSLAVMLWVQGRLTEAEPLFVDALNRYHQLPVPEDRYMLECLKRYAQLLVEMKRYSEAESQIEEIVRLTPMTHDDFNLITNDWLLANLRREQGHLAAAEHLYRAALVEACRQAAELCPESADRLTEFVTSLETSNSTPVSSPPYRKIFATLVRCSKNRQANFDPALLDLGLLELRKDRFEAAEPIFRRVSDAVENSPRVQPWMSARLDGLLGYCLARLGRWTEAEVLLLRSHDTFQTVFHTEHPGARFAGRGLAELYDAWQEAEPSGHHKIKAAEWREDSPALNGAAR